MAEEIALHFTAKDDASKVADALQKKVDKLDGETAEVELKTDDKASKTVDSVTKDLKKLDGTKAEIEIKADDNKAKSSLADVLEIARKLDADSATVVVTARADEAKAELRNTLQDLAKLDASDPLVDIKIAHAAELNQELNHIQTELERIDRTRVSPTVDLKTTGGGFTGKVEEIIASSKLGSAAIETLGTSASGMGATVATAATVAGAAIGTFAVKGIQDFVDLGTQIDTFSQISGLPLDTASRFVAVADDFGVSAESLGGSIGKLGKTLNINADALANYGVTVARAKDGSIDLAATTLNVIDAYNRTTDATKRIGLGTAAFGKGYAELIPLIEQGSKNIVSALGDVSDAQIWDEKKNAQSKKAKADLDNLHDAMGDLQLTLGRDLLPVLHDFADNISTISGLAQKLNDVVPFGAFGKLASTAQDIINPLHAVRSGIKQVTDVINVFRGETEKPITLDTTGIIVGIEDAAHAQHQLDINTAEAALSTQDFVKFQNDLKGALDATNAALDQQIENLNKQVEGAQNTADAGIAFQNAEEGVAKATAETIKVQKDKKHTSEDLTAATEKERDAVITAGKAQQSYQEDAAAASGVTVTATNHIDGLNDSLLNQAKNATPAARQAVADYLIDLNQIPPEKATEIKAAIAAGDIETAERLINEASRTREASINVDANTDPAMRKLKALAAFIERNFPNVLDMGGAIVADAGGVMGPFGGIAGERRSEILDGRYITTGATYVPPGTKVTSGKRTAVWLRRQGLKGYDYRRPKLPPGYDRGTTGAPTPIGALTTNNGITVNVNAAVIGNRFDVMRAVRRATYEGTRLLGSRS